MNHTNLTSIILVLIFTGLLYSCAPKLTTDWTKEGYSKRSFQKVAVVGISENLQARMTFERTAVAQFKKEGVNAVEGISIFPPKMTEQERQPENLVKIIKENQLDGVITMSLISEEEGSRYQPGEDYVIPAGYARFGRYYVRRYARVRTPGYYEETKNYLIEAVLYDLGGELKNREETLVWTGQSTLVDPSSIESAAQSFTRRMVSHMVNNEIIKVE